MADKNLPAPPDDDDDDEGELEETHMEIIGELLQKEESDLELTESDMHRLELAKTRVLVDIGLILAEMTSELRQLRIFYKKALKDDAK